MRTTVAPKEFKGGGALGIGTVPTSGPIAIE